MPKEPRPDAAPNRRGSPEAVEKRRAARAFNDLLTDGQSQLDGRTEKRRRRLLEELQSGKTRTGRELKPVEVLTHVNELVDLGEPIANLRKVLPAAKGKPASADLTTAVSKLHRAYGFRAETYRFVGIGDDVLRAAGILDRAPRRRRSSN